MKKQELELSIRAVCIGMILAIILGGSNVYLGMKTGTTISASIPAAIISMLILKLIKNYSIKENSIAQTTASIGEACAGSAIFILPALLITGVWQDFPYLEVVILSISGGILGIINSTILRKVFLSDQSLRFPEGVAIANVLKMKGSKKDGVLLIIGMLFSGMFNLGVLGLHIITESYYKFIKIKGTIYGGGFGLSLAVISAGALMGYAAGIVMLIGFVIGWIILLPHFIKLQGIPANATDFTVIAFSYWKIYIRPIGIGIFIAGGIVVAIRLIKPIYQGIVSSFKVLDSLSNLNTNEQDLNSKTLSTLFAIVVITLFCLFLFHINQLNNYGLLINSFITTPILIIVLFLGFILSSIAGYFAGLVGSSNSPSSSLNLISAFVLTGIIIYTPFFKTVKDIDIIGLIILFIAVIDFSVAPSNENSQDYKSGSLVGSTPYKQQIALIFGLISFSLFLPFFMKLIFHAYGISGIIPQNSNLNINETLSAPQASAIAALVTNIINHQADWSLIFIGISIGLTGFFIDLVGDKLNKFRFPVPALGTGFYLPPSVSVTLFIGGLVDLIIKKIHKKILIHNNYAQDIVEKLAKSKIRSELLLAGLIAGESIVGLILAVPFVIKGSSDVLTINLGSWYNSNLRNIISILIIVLAIYKIIKISIAYKK